MEGVREVFFKMLATGCPGLPVINDKMELTGVITAFDLLKAIRKGISLDDITVDQIVSNTITVPRAYPWVSMAPQSADMDTPLETLIDMMINNNYTIIPIVKKQEAGRYSEQE
jgi:CBS-domain-containing membrane protein